MTRKTSQAYLAVFKLIENKLLKLEPAEFMTDFEDGMRLAIRNNWPNTTIRGCWFHFKRAINRKCVSFGLKWYLQRNNEANMIVSMLGNLPLLPAHRIQEAYNGIKNLSKQKSVNVQLNDVFKYFECYWIKQVRCVYYHPLRIITYL